MLLLLVSMAVIHIQFQTRNKLHVNANRMHIPPIQQNELFPKYSKSYDKANPIPPEQHE